MREAGDVCFADSFKDGSGVVEFLRYEDMKYAIKKLDDSRFRSHEVCTKFIHSFMNPGMIGTALYLWTTLCFMFVSDAPICNVNIFKIYTAVITLKLHLCSII